MKRITLIAIILTIVAICPAATFTSDPNDITIRNEVVTIPCVITMTINEYAVMQDLGKQPTDIADIVRVMRSWLRDARRKLTDAYSYSILKSSLQE